MGFSAGDSSEMRSVEDTIVLGYISERVST